MKKELFTFVLMMLPLVASADAVKINGIWYNLTAGNLQAEVTYNEYEGYSGNVEIPEVVTYESVEYSVTSIGNYAFYSSNNLTSVTIPNSVTSIGENAFWFSGITSITIPNSVTSIKKNTFQHCYHLTSVTIGNGVKTIAKDAFSDCTGLITVTFGNSLTSIGEEAFERCTSLTSINIPNNVKTIVYRAFASCSGLTSITIGSGVTSIGTYAFNQCSGITSITVDEGNSKYDSRNNCNAIIEKSTNKLILGCKNSTIPNGVTSIEDRAFDSCYGMTSVTIPSSVTSIGNAAFQYTNLSTVVSLIENPFAIKAKGTPNISTFSDDTFNNATLYVPVGTIDTYKATTGWKDFANIVEGTPTGINGIENTQDNNATIYNLNGVRQLEPKKGINIINGKKVVIK